MKKVALVTGADRGLGLALCAGLLDQGWQVLAGQYMPDWPELATLADRHPYQVTILPLDVASDSSVQAAATMASEQVSHVDLLINNAGVNSPKTYQIPLEEPQDFGEMQRVYDVNSLGPLRVVNAFLPLTNAGEMKRLCFVSSEAGSIERAKRTSWYGYCMSKAALNMGVKLMFNRLRPDGYTFRLYHPGWMRTYMGGVKSETGDMEADVAAKPALAYFLRESTAEDSIDEDRLVMVDWQGEEWPW